MAPPMACFLENPSLDQSLLPTCGQSTARSGGVRILSSLRGQHNGSEVSGSGEF